jgi:DNA-binding response OmpR family regulator
MATGRILVIEDDESILELLRDMLELEGYECRGLRHPHLVPDVVRRWKPHVTLLDVMLPRLSGIEVAEGLQTQGITGSSLIAMSASTAMCEIAEHSGLFATVLKKPFDLDTLFQAVHGVKRSCSEDEGEPEDNRLGPKSEPAGER